MITFAVLKKFLFKPVKKMIDDRQAEIDTMYADADAAKQKAAELEQEYQQHLQSIRDERDTLLREATARAQKREEEIVGEAVPKQPPCAPLLKLILHRNARKQSTT